MRYWNEDYVVRIDNKYSSPVEDSLFFSNS